MAQHAGLTSDAPAGPSAVPDQLNTTLTRLTRAREALEVATNEWRSAGEAAQRALRDCGSSASWKSQPTSPVLGRLMTTLYWDFAEIGPECIAEAFGLDGAYQVYGLVCASEEP